MQTQIDLSHMVLSRLPPMGSLPPSVVLRRVMIVREQRNMYWVSGSMLDNTDVSVEISFEPQEGFKPLPETQLSYLGMWQKGFSSKPYTRCIFEFQLGVMVTKPSIEDWLSFAQPIIHEVRGYHMVNGMLLKANHSSFIDQ